MPLTKTTNTSTEDNAAHKNFIANVTLLLTKIDEQKCGHEKIICVIELYEYFRDNILKIHSEKSLYNLIESVYTKNIIGNSVTPFTKKDLAGLVSESSNCCVNKCDMFIELQNIVEEVKELLRPIVEQEGTEQKGNNQKREKKRKIEPTQPNYNLRPRKPINYAE